MQHVKYARRLTYDLRSLMERLADLGVIDLPTITLPVFVTCKSLGGNVVTSRPFQFRLIHAVVMHAEAPARPWPGLAIFVIFFPFFLIHQVFFEGDSISALERPSSEFSLSLYTRIRLHGKGE